MSFTFVAAVTVWSDFGAQENKICHCFHCFPFYLPWNDGTRCYDLSFWMLNFNSVFSFSSFTFIKKLFISFLLSAIRVVPFACLKLLIFLSAILIPVCDSFSLAFHLMYSAFELNKQGDNIQPWHIPFQSLNQYIIPCPMGMLGYSNSKVKCALKVPGKLANTTEGRFVWRKTYGVFCSNSPYV